MANHSYIKYLTEQLVMYLNKSSAEKTEQKRVKENKTIYSNHWFGLVPFAVKMVFKR